MKHFDVHCDRPVFDFHSAAQVQLYIYTDMCDTDVFM